MVKEKRIKLHPWQKQITKEEYLKELETGTFGIGYFAPTQSYYKVDMENAEYKKHLEVKQLKKKQRHEKQSEMKSALRAKIKELNDVIKILKVENKSAKKRLTKSVDIAKEAAKIEVQEARIAEKKRKLGLVV